jgi:hypothetical protein
LSAHGRLVVGGVVAAALGLGAVTVAVLLLWIPSPYPDSGLSGALHAAASLWLLAHGAELVRTGTLSGAAAPLGVTPLMLSALPLWLLYRTARHAVESHEEDLTEAGRDPAGPPPAGPTIGWLSAGYLLVGMVVVSYASGGPLRVDPLSVVLHLPLVTVAAVSYGFWAAAGRPREPLVGVARQAVDRIPDAAWSLPLQRCRAVLTRHRVVTAIRGATVGTAVLVGGGALLVALSLAWHALTSGQAFQGLPRTWPGRFAVLLLAFALVPNAAVWAAAYTLGAGFTLGAGSVVSPLGTSAHPELPHFPLLAAVPEAGPGGPPTWAVGALPTAAGITVGWFIARAAVPRPAPGLRRVRGRRDTALTAALASAACGVAMALLAGFAGGPLGSHALDDFGPSWWLTGGATFCWTALAALPTALIVRWGRKRRPRRRAVVPGVRRRRAARSRTPAGAAPRQSRAPSRGRSSLGRRSSQECRDAVVRASSTQV